MMSASLRPETQSIAIERAIRNEFLRRFLAHARLDAEPAKHLERAHVEEGGARQR